MRISGDIIDISGKDNRFLKNIITGDETWCFLYDLQTQRKSNRNHHHQLGTKVSIRQGKGISHVGNLLLPAHFPL